MGTRRQHAARMTVVCTRSIENIFFFCINSRNISLSGPSLTQAQNKPRNKLENEPHKLDSKCHKPDNKPHKLDSKCHKSDSKYHKPSKWKNMLVKQPQACSQAKLRGRPRLTSKLTYAKQVAKHGKCGWAIT